MFVPLKIYRRFPHLSVFPRLIFTDFSTSDYISLLSYEEEQNEVIALVLEAVVKYSFDGIVLEIWSELSHRGADKQLMKMVKKICEFFFSHSWLAVCKKND